MRRQFYLLALGLILLACPVQAQKAAPAADYLAWSATRRLTAADFQLPLKSHNNLRGGSAAFSFSMDGRVGDLFGKHSNDIIVNRMLCTASWLDTTNRAAIAQQLLFQQTLFDI